MIAVGSRLILLSSFSEDANRASMRQSHVQFHEFMTELVVSVFAETQTAFLARAVLARLQKELALPARDVALVTREEDGEVTVQEAVATVGDVRTSTAFWRMLVELLFSSAHSTSEVTKEISLKLAALGIDRDALSAVADHVDVCGSALFVLTHGESTRDQVLGVMQGFDGKISHLILREASDLAPDSNWPT